MVSAFESSSSLRNLLGKWRRPRTTPAARTGPASGPRPASSTPQTSPLQPRSILKSGIVPPNRLLPQRWRSSNKAPRRCGTGRKEHYVPRMSDSEFPSMRRRIGLLLATLTLLVPLALSHANALNLFATNEVTAQFATHDGKPMVDAQVRVFAPGEAKTPVVTGNTDADGKFVFEADRDGFWSAEAHNADEVARVMIRVGGESQSQSQSRISPFYILGLLAILLAIA